MALSLGYWWLLLCSFVKEYELRVQLFTWVFLCCLGPGILLYLWLGPLEHEYFWSTAAIWATSILTIITPLLARSALKMIWRSHKRWHELSKNL